MGVSIIGAVTPLAGVWIEILVPFRLLPADIVTPLAGVWIEIELYHGSKYYWCCHSPCGSVD